MSPYLSIGSTRCEREIHGSPRTNSPFKSTTFASIMRKWRREKIRADAHDYADRQKIRLASRTRRRRHGELIHAIERDRLATMAAIVALCDRIGARHVETKPTLGGRRLLHIDTGDLLSFTRDGDLLFYTRDFEHTPEF